MTTDFSYQSARWRAISAQARARDGQSCTVARLLGGDCSPYLHAHHLVPIDEDPTLIWDLDNVVTACAKHHPRLEALRRSIMDQQRPQKRVRCPHQHRYPGAREACERRLARQVAA